MKSMASDNNNAQLINRTNGASRRTSFLQQACGCQYNPRVETLEYDYCKDATSIAGKQQPLPRIRQRGEFYIDSYNAESWSCSFGTHEEVCWIIRLLHENYYLRACFLGRSYVCGTV